MPFYSPPNYAQMGMGMQQSAASTAGAMRPGTTTTVEKDKSIGGAIGAAAQGRMAGAMLAGTEVGGAALASLGVSAAAAGPVGIAAGAGLALASFFL